MDVRRAKTNDPEDWLELSPEFSRPLAMQVREWILHWEPDLAEAIKWNALCFSGRKLICGMSACKKHLGLAFFRGTELPDPARLLTGGENNTNILSIRLATFEGFNRDALRALLRAAVELDAEPALPPPPKAKREPWPVPEFFAAALKRNKKAAAGFAKLSPSCQREYLAWLSTARRPETREKRLAETLQALATGRKWIDRKRD